MTTGQWLVVLQFLINAGWVLLPLAPAVLIYRLFPNTKTGLRGPFGSLTINASGAFAAYFLVFLATLPLINQMNRNLKSELRPSWTIKGQIVAQDENRQEIRPSELDGDVIRISFEPNGLQLRKNLSFEATVPEIEGSVPAVYVEYVGVGTKYVDFGNLEPADDVDINEDDRVITIRSPILIRKEPCIGIDCSPAQ